MKRFFVFAFLTFGLLAITQQVSAAGITMPCNGPDCQACHIVQLGQTVINWLIGITASIIMLVFAIGGLKMVMAGGDTGAVTNAKHMMTNAVVGFILLLGSWLIINTLLLLFTDSSKIGAWNAVQCVPQPERTTAPVTPPVTAGTQTGATTGCADSCTTLGSGITVKNGACSGSSPCTVSSQIASDLNQLDSKLDSAGINWQVTEAYPPTMLHQNACHAAGTCVDANCIGGCSASQVRTFTESASASGLRAVYEVRTQAERDSLVSSGVSASNVQVVSRITAPHFSVYNN